MSVGRYFGETNPGRKRRRNEDSFVSEPPLFAVADGMGGAQAGEVASSLAAAALAGAGTEDVAPGDAEAVVVGLIQEANRRVHQRATNDAAASGMGTTMTVAYAGADGVVTIGHVGDSRAYLMRDGELEQLTDDHSLVAELVRRGELSPEEAEVHPQRSVITRALGTDPDVDVDVFSLDAKAGDLFLLCSDGLSTMVDADRIAEIVEANRGDLRGAARALIKAANDSGGEDNITAVLFEIDGNRDGGPRDEQTVETVVRHQDHEVTSADDEDTLDPSDAVPVVRDSDGAAEGDTMVVPTGEIAAAMAAEAAGSEQPEPPQVPFARLVLATLVIVVLAAIVIALVVWGLAR